MATSQLKPRRRFAPSRGLINAVDNSISTSLYQRCQRFAHSSVILKTPADKRWQTPASWLTNVGIESLYPWVTLKRLTLKRRYQNEIELLQGTLDLLVLQTLQWGPQHGYGIARSIGISSGEALEVDAGSLYPALHRLERQGWIKSHWRLSDNQQRVKEYRLTRSGKKQLLSERSRWETLVAAVTGVLNRRGAQ